MDKPANAVSPAMLHAGRRSSAYVIALSCVAAIGGFLFGFDSGVINGAVDALAKAFGPQAAGTGFAVASVLLGCAVGAFGAGTLADSLGRRPTMLLNAILFFASAVATGAANSAGVFIAARIAGGIAIGAASVLAPMYIAEVAPAHIRGRLASLQQMAIVTGLFCAFGRKPIEGIALNPKNSLRATRNLEKPSCTKVRVRVSIVIVILCCSAAVARSQDTEASAGTRSLGCRFS